MMNFSEYSRNITGHLKISQRSSSGEEKVLFDDPNVIVSGMSVGLSYLFTASGSDTITDYQLSRFQVGVSGNDTAGSAIFQLSGPLSSFSEYGGTAGPLRLVSSIQIKNGSTTTSEAFALIPHSHVTRINETSVRYTIILDKDSCNNITRAGPGTAGALNEIGLFMRNPRGMIPDQTILVAYRKFSDIIKTSDFALVFRWTINW